MKIDTTIRPNMPSGTTRPAKSLVSPSASSSTEQVAISSLSSHLQEMGEAGSGEEVVNAERVAEIKQAISEGRFKINPERIADRVLEDVRRMLNASGAVH